MYKLPVINMITRAMAVPWRSPRRFLVNVVLPAFLLAGLACLFDFYRKEENRFLILIIGLIWMVAAVAFSVACHRLVLAEEVKPNHPIESNMLIRILKFMGCVIGVAILSSIPLMITWPITRAFDKPSEFALFLMCIPSYYLIGRLSLVFPSTAIDRNIGMSRSWNFTSGNGFQMLLIVGIFPAIIDLIFSELLWQDNAGTIEYYLLTLVGMLLLAIEIFALSLTYKELC